jgi:Fanconi anemia group J protein
VVKKSIGNKKVDFTYNNVREMGDKAHIESGRSIVELCKVTPGGILVFFPSYRMMEDAILIWGDNGIVSEIEQTKKFFNEPKDPKQYALTIKKYYNTIYPKSKKVNSTITGAILLGVCRGKISEGLDFSDNAARGVVIIGIPYPSMVDPKTILKKYYLDYKKKNGPFVDGLACISGQDWYSQ